VAAPAALEQLHVHDSFVCTPQRQKTHFTATHASTVCE
jgi:hypothetical protein